MMFACNIYLNIVFLLETLFFCRYYILFSDRWKAGNQNHTDTCCCEWKADTFILFNVYWVLVL